MQSAKYIGKAWEGAVEGMNTAADHAERKKPEWKERAFDFFCSYAEYCGRDFLTEEVVEAAKLQEGLDAPDNRAWGSVANRASNKGIVIRAGFAYNTLGKGHSGPRSVWRFKQ